MVPQLSIRVLLADDQAMVRAGFRMILESDPEIEVVSGGGQRRNDYGQHPALGARIVLMDIQMPDGDGLEAAADDRRRRSCTVVC